MEDVENDQGACAVTTRCQAESLLWVPSETESHRPQQLVVWYVSGTVNERPSAWTASLLLWCCAASN